VFSNELLVSLSVTGAVTCLIVGIYFWLSDARSAKKRLSAFGSHRDSGGTFGAAETDDRYAPKGMLQLLIPRFAEQLRPRSVLDQDHLRLRMARAGFDAARASEIYLCAKVICLIGGCISGGALIASFQSVEKYLYSGAIFAGCLGFYLPDLVVGWLTSRRQEQILLALPNAIDLLIVAIEVGQGLDAAMRRVAKELERSAPALAQEFSLYNLHLNMGKVRSEALHELGLRAGVTDLNAFAAVLVQADRFGASIAKTMRQLSESARRKRRQLAEERAQKTAVKLIFPLVLFIFPGIFAILVGPAAILIMKDLTGMQ
jgi:tight adherence protein C